MSVTRKVKLERHREQSGGKRPFDRNNPADKKEMKKIWRREPWRWFFFDPRDVVNELLGRKNHLTNQWAQTILDCERVAMCKKYQVLIRTGVFPVFGEMAHLYIQSPTGMKIRPWTDFQRIKDDLCGPEFCGVEVYPPRDELVDDIDMWHLWVFEHGVRMPFFIGDARPKDIEWTFPGKANWVPKDDT